MDYDTSAVKNIPSNEFGNTVKDIEDMWYAISEAYDDAVGEISGKSSTDAQANVAFEAFKGQIKKKYYNYLLNDAKYHASIRDNAYKTIPDLKKYFKYQSYSRARDEYNKAMREHGMSNMKPSDWCKNGVCPSRDRVFEVITSKADAQWNSKASGIEHNLNFWEFLQNKKIKRNIISEVTKNFTNEDLENFNYSYNDFARLTNRNVSSDYSAELQKNIQAQNKAISSKKLFQKYGVTNIYYPNGWSGFVRSDAIQKVILDSVGQKRLNEVTKALENKDLSGI